MTTNAGGFVRFERERTSKLSAIPDEARERFRCALWSCVLSRYACALRWTQAKMRQTHGSATDLRPSESPFSRCARCSIGRANAALIPAEALKKKVTR